MLLIGCCLFWGVGAASGEALDVYILAGQSNAAGSANVTLSSFPSEQQTTFPEILYTHDTNGDVEAWGPLQPRLISNGSRRWVGAELTFGETLLDAGNENVAIVKFARDGTSLQESWREDGPLRAEFYDFVDNALMDLEQLGHTHHLAGFIWIQGSGDAGSEDRATNYNANLAAFIGELESRYNATTTVLNRYHINANRPHTPLLRAGQQALGNADQDVFLVNTDDLALNSDNIHFTDLSDLEVGRRLGDKYLQSQELAGDYNRDGAIDSRDYAAWRESLGSLSALNADGDGDGVVEQDDYALWQTGFGLPAVASAAALASPEPASAWGLLLATGAAAFFRRR